MICFGIVYSISGGWRCCGGGSGFCVRVEDGFFCIFDEILESYGSFF